MTWVTTATQKAGTTSLANCLKLHPAISGMDGLPWHEALSKESHFFNGVFGPNHASSATLYRSFFPTLLCRWWAEHVRGVKKVHLLMCSVAKRAFAFNASAYVSMYTIQYAYFQNTAASQDTLRCCAGLACSFACMSLFHCGVCCSGCASMPVLLQHACRTQQGGWQPSTLMPNSSSW